MKLQEKLHNKLVHLMYHYSKPRYEALYKRLDQEQLDKHENRWLVNFTHGDSFLYEMPNGIRMNLYRDSILSKYIFLDWFEKNETDFIQQVLQPGDHMLDIGANIGLFSLLAAKLVGPTGKVIAFEPTPRTYERLVSNISANGFAQAEARHLGLSDTKGELSIQLSQDGHDAWNTFASAADEKFHDKVMVPVDTLDAQLETMEKEKIRLVKIDVEGWEKFVLTGGKQFFTQYQPMVLVEFTEANTFAAGYLVQEVYDIMTNWGYQWHAFEKGQLVPATKKLHYPYENLVAIKQG